jgi:hypothetical protein
MTDEKKYKPDIKSRLARVVEDGRKVLGVRSSKPAPPPARGEVPPKKP